MTTHSSPFISLPRKSTIDADFATPIRHTIAQVYGERPDGYSDDIAQLTRCRADAVKGAASDATARDLLFKYFGQLELLELRFAETKISFLWNDAYTRKATTQTSLAFEKASILHLLSSVLSHLAATSPRTSPDGVKRAYAALRQSSGLLHFINENFLHAPSTDLSREVVSFSGKLMITQAGETFLEKCISEKKPAALVSKMCQSVAAGYASLLEDTKDFIGKGIMEKNWINVVGIKQKYFASLAQWYRAGVDTDKGEYGAGLVRYGIADKLAAEAHKLAKEFNYVYDPAISSSPAYINWLGEASAADHQTLPADAATALLEITKSYQTITTESKNTSEKDNDLVYHAIPPSEASLPAIDPLPAAGLAAPITIQEIYAQPTVSSLIGPDIFRKLVPLEVHEKASVYSEEKAKLVRAEQERCDVGESETRAALEDLKVREKINRFKAVLEGNSFAGSSRLPREIDSWSDELRNRERGQVRIEEVIQETENRRQKLDEDLRSLSQELDEESRECEKMRAKHGHLFPQSPSSTTNRQYKSDLKSHSDSLYRASSSDRSIGDNCNGIKQDVGVLTGDVGRLERMYADAEMDRGQANVNLLDVEVAQDEMDGREKEVLASSISVLEELLSRLDKVRREREDVLKDLKEKIQSDDVSHLLLLNRRSQGVEPTLFASELEKFSPYQARLSAALDSQSSIVDEMSLVIKQTEGGRGVRDAQRRMGGAEKRRVELDRRFRSAFEGYGEVRADLDKADHFYDSLTTLVDNLRRGVRSFVSSRTQQRNRIISQIEAGSNPSRNLEDNFGSLSLSTGGRQNSNQYPSTSPAPPAVHSPYVSTPYGSTSPPPRDPYDFSSFASSVPSAFSSDPRSGQAPSRAPTLPPPPPKPTSSYSGYGLPPPPPQIKYGTQGTGQQSNGAPGPYSTLNYGAAPPPSQSQGGYSSYSSPPPQQQQQTSVYPAYPPIQGSPYASIPSPPPQNTGSPYPPYSGQQPHQGVSSPYSSQPHAQSNYATPPSHSTQYNQGQGRQGYSAPPSGPPAPPQSPYASYGQPPSTQYGQAQNGQYGQQRYQ